jgi:protease-4
VYLDFKSRVSEGRKMSMASVDSIAQGRVWTGKRAVTIGLADSIGGLKAALAEASKLAGIKEYRLRTYPEKKSLLDYVLNSNADRFSSFFLKKELGTAEYALVKQIQDLKQKSGSIQARLPFTFTLQ